MVADGIPSVEGAIEQKRRVQHRPNHVIKVAHEGLPAVEMGVLENREGIVVMKPAAECSSIGCRCRSAERDERQKRAEIRNHEQPYTASR